jgi:hypothetical protein
VTEPSLASLVEEHSPSGFVVDFSLVGGHEVYLDEGEEILFGRAMGRGQVSGGTDQSVSSVHGSILRTQGNWSVSSLGSRYSFAVYDIDTPSRTFVPLGAKNVPVAYARAVIAIEITEDRRHVFTVSSPGISGWAEGWRSVLRQQQSDQLDLRGLTAVAEAHRSIKATTGTGRALAWFRVLVAMCEPKLKPPFTGVSPSRADIISRLQFSKSSVSHLDDEYVPRIRKELGLNRLPSGSQFSRLVECATTIAIAQGIVTQQDLALLPRETLTD